MLKSTKLQAHIEDHCVPIVVRRTDWSGARYPVQGFYKVVKPLHAFKQVSAIHATQEYMWSSAIANLIIPVGATIFVHPAAFTPGSDIEYRKMRASEALVHSIARQRTGAQVLEATSNYSTSFKYKVGKVVKPQYRFSKTPTQCASGIHFFVNLPDAKRWG